MIFIDWRYIADMIIYVFGYIIIIYLVYALSDYCVEYSRINKTKAATLKEKAKAYIFAFFMVATIALLFSLKTKHRPEKYIIAFISLIVPAFLGIAKAYQRDKKMNETERLQRKELLGIRNANRDM